MTDLERVRDWAEDSFNFPLIDEAIDAHLKEDAERDKYLIGPDIPSVQSRAEIHAQLVRTQAELTEAQEQWHRQDESFRAQIRVLTAELTELRGQSCAWSCVGVPYEKRGDAHKRTCRP